MSTPTPILPAALMVPMAVEALVINPYVRSWPHTNWRQFTPNWEGFARSGTPPFSTSGYSELTAANDGVYLHWAVPKAFTSATVPETKDPSEPSIAFSYAPNRWLVMRLAPPANGTRALAAWVIQSDYLVSNSSNATPAGSSPYVQPFTSAAGQLVPATVGTHIELARYTGDLTSEATSLFLTAAGPGDVSFAAYQPGLTDVFSFFDASLGSTDAVAPLGSYDYLVMGWISDPAGDPLAPPAQGSTSSTSSTDWTNLLASLDWTLLAGPTAPGQSIPATVSTTICHGAVLGVAWPGESTTAGPASSAPDPTTCTVVVGSTPLDALCTQIQSSGPSGAAYERHLQALLTGMLPSVATPSGRVRIDEAVERARFGSTHGGTLWTVAPAPIVGMPSPSTVVTLTPALQAKLDALNAAQAKLDAHARELAAAQFDLYGTWWKNLQASNFIDPYAPPEGLTAAEWATVTNYLTGQLVDSSSSPDSDSTLLTEASALQTKVQALATKVTSAQSQLETALGTAYALKPAPWPRFYQPADPAVLVQGVPPGTKYGENASYTEGCLQCRYSSQLIAGLQYSPTLPLTVAQLGSVLPLPSNSALPGSIVTLAQALLVETFFLNPANAPLVAQQVGASVDAATLAADMSPTATDLLGTAPAPIGFVATWRQPFTPLYLDWTVEFVPTPLTQMSGWTFDGDDYAFSGTVDATQNTGYSGRALLTPHAADIFRQRVEHYITQAGASADPDLKKLLARLAATGALDTPAMLTQTLSGLGTMQLLQDPSPNYPPDSTVASVVGYQFQAVPGTDAIADLDMRSAPQYFFPVRAGWIRFTRLEVLDCFGQCVNLLAGNGNTSGIAGDPHYFLPITAPELTPDSGTTLAKLGQAGNWVKLAPRILQTARLDLTLLPAAASAAPGSNPVHGWLVPNHLDQSVAVYDATGVLLGEIVSLLDTTTGTATTAAWQPAPASGANPPPAAPSDITDPTLQNVVAGLVAASADGAAFQDFMDVIDETQWSADPLGGRADANLSVLMGLPLAVVEVQLQLSLEGGPAQDQSFTNTYNVANGDAPNTENLLTQSFSVRLGDLQRGDDGVIGYFTNSGASGFATFNSVLDPTTVDADAAASTYIQPIGGANANYLSLTAGAAGAITVPVLFDPRGSIHAVSGVHPVAKVALDAAFVTAPEAAMALTFRTGPLLTDPATIRMPRPAENNGGWSWLGYQTDSSGVGSYGTMPIIAANQTARLGDAPGINEGWLQFTPQSQP